MDPRYSAFQGCLLGMAVGDAMGYTVDSRNLEQIRADYGPNGLLGYDLVNGRAEVTSYTQIAAFSANGILMGLTRNRLSGRQTPLVRYIGLALREWSRSQSFHTGEPNFCWLSFLPDLRRRRCMDTWMLSVLEKPPLGTMEAPTNRSSHPAALTAVIPLAMLSESMHLSQEEVDHMGAEIVAMTHGNPDAFLAAAVLTHLLSRVLQEPSMTLEELIPDTCDALQLQFGRLFTQTATIRELLQLALMLAKDDSVSSMEAMEKLGCHSAAEVLAGAVYACITCGEDFDTAIITAVNHSGRSAAVGAITGALLGARLGYEALPEFYLESLEPLHILLELANDLVVGCPMEIGSSLFDDDWDRKYLRAGQE